MVRTSTKSVAGHKAKSADLFFCRCCMLNSHRGSNHQPIKHTYVHCPSHIKICENKLFNKKRAEQICASRFCMISAKIYINYPHEHNQI